VGDPITSPELDAALMELEENREASNSKELREKVVELLCRGFRLRDERLYDEMGLVPLQRRGDDMKENPTAWCPLAGDLVTIHTPEETRRIVEEGTADFRAEWHWVADYEALAVETNTPGLFGVMKMDHGDGTITQVTFHEGREVFRFRGTPAQITEASAAWKASGACPPELPRCEAMSPQGERCGLPLGHPGRSPKRHENSHCEGWYLPE
jgi:hypothetical protein